MKAKDVKKAIKKMNFRQILKVERIVSEMKERKAVDLIVKTVHK